MDWHAWHRDYEGETPLARRLVIVQSAAREALARYPIGPIRIVSICAGDGRDVLGVLDGHPAAPRVTGRLVELDPGLADRARLRAEAAGLALDVVVADAGSTDAYAGAVPANLVLVCGAFGNISDADVEGTIRALPMLPAPGGTVIWTRSRREPDLTPAIRGWFEEAGFAEVAFVAVPDSLAGVGVHRLDGNALPLRPSLPLFRFTRTE